MPLMICNVSYVFRRATLTDPIGCFERYRDS